MKTNALIAALAATCLAAPALADSYADGWLTLARAKVDQKLEHAGLARGPLPVEVRMHIDGAGDLYSPQIVTSSGSTAIDAAVLKAVRHVSTPLPPAELAGRDLHFRLSVGPTETAALPGPQRR